ncbi:hypothetical protein JZO66_05630 [Enterococcus sp. DIV0242_7C1]|uniref:Uncharacterized protein n=1 Tax=Candidatus Enterococcus dunnyi TaxID=1834192 RepID=A0A200J0W6_9ENTE|nr:MULTISPECIES: hypothetical protein [unclassified Enterococcus]MBO0470015.1 hypothetical protein [Enterococcus sp. DIV0242_7C1]OUZ30461.1 hypothetical protein A5889_002749 [Enterococcus sp. 9D6_DIV0238]
MNRKEINFVSLFLLLLGIGVLLISLLEHRIIFVCSGIMLLSLSIAIRSYLLKK